MTLSLRQHRSAISTVAQQDWKGRGMIRSHHRVIVYPDLKRQEFLKNIGPVYMSMFRCMLPAEWILCSVNMWRTSSAQKKWTRWQGCFLAYPTVFVIKVWKWSFWAQSHASHLQFLQSTARPQTPPGLWCHRPTAGRWKEHNYLYKYQLTNSAFSIKLKPPTKSHETDYIRSEHAHTFSVSSSSLSAVKSNLATPCTAECMPGIGWPGNRKQVEKLIVW